MKHKPWFDNGCSEILDQKKQARLQWLQDPSKINEDNRKVKAASILRTVMMRWKGGEKECM
jgi:hypothetical protein